MQPFSEEGINPRVVDAENAVRGKLSVEAMKINHAIANAKKEGKKSPYSFDNVIATNIGNPQRCGQQCLTFYRQVLAIVEDTSLLNHPEIYPKDVIERAKKLIESTGCSGTTGAYSPSKGIEYVRQTICDFIERRDNDGYKVDIEDVFMTDGASSGIRLLLNMLVSGPEDGIMIPIPHYPIYSATIALLNGSEVDYTLDEDDNWSIDMKSVREAYDKATAKGIHVKAFTIVNPGNPTGQILTEENMREIIQFCYEKNMCIMADEVYQDNVYCDRKFISFRKVLHSMPKEISEGLQLVSFFSISKGYYGECGKRGGYFQLDNIGEFAKMQMYKMMSINLCSNVDGQIVFDLVCNPPKPGDESYELFAKERDAILGSLKRKAISIEKALNECKGIHCNDAMGALYLFPRVDLPKKFVDECLSRNEKPDEEYCLLMLKEEGICVIPGSGFGQRPGTYHYRLAILPPEEQIMAFNKKVQAFHKRFMEKYE